MATDSSTSMASGQNLGDQSRFAKLQMAINDVLNQAYRDILEMEVPPSYIENRITGFYKRLRPYQEDLVKKAIYSGYKNFDISLTYVLIRNICEKIPKPTKGKWGDEPAAGEVAVGDDIERIRVIRNRLTAHVSSASIPEAEFDDIWSMMSDMCERLEVFTGKKYLNKLNDIQKMTFREEREDDLIQKIKMAMATDSNILMASVKRILDRSRFAKLGMAANDVLNQAYRDILEMEVLPSDVENKVKAAPVYRRLRPDQVHLLQDAKHSGYKKFYFSFTYTLIRNICSKVPKPTKGKWGVKPAAGEVTVGDDIERIRSIRQTFMVHVTSASTPENEFNEIWSMISDICLRLETFTGKKYLENINEIQKLIFREGKEDDLIEKIKLELENGSNREKGSLISLSKEDFENELRHGSCKIRQVRIMVVGHYGVGKTTLTYGLIGEDKKVIESTDGIDLFRARCRIQDSQHDSRNWGLVHKNFISPAALAAALNASSSYREEQRQSTGISKKGKRETTFVEEREKQTLNKSPDRSSKNNETVTPISQSVKRSDKTSAQYETDDEDISQYGKPEKSFEKGGKRSKYSSEFHEKSQNARTPDLEKRMKDIFIDLWDFGGQNVFYTTHQSFLTSRCIYLLVINCAKDLNAPLQDRSLYPTQRSEPKVEDFIDFWVSTITNYANSDKPGFPRIILIGTHADKLVKNTSNRIKEVCLEIKERYQGLVDKGQLVIKEDLFLNAKDTDEEKHAFVREFIIQEAKRQPHWEELFPKSWLHLLDFIVTKREDGLDILTLKELKEFNQNSIVPLTEFSLENMLQRQHDIGDIIFFNTDKLKDIIVLDPSFLIRALKSLISTRGHMEKAGVKAEIWKNLSTKGVVSEDAIKEIWSSNELLNNHADILLNIFQHMDILVKPKSYNDGKQVSVHQEKIFFIPCMIEELNSIERVDKFFENSEELFEFYDISINHGILVPPAIGYRLLSFCTSMWPVVEGRLFTACGFFRLDLHHILLLKIYPSNIRVYVVHRRSKRSISPALYNSVNRTLISFLEACLLQFHSNLTIINGCREMEDDALSHGIPNCNENCPGIGYTCHGKTVEEVELSRLVRYLSPTHLYPLGVELGILSREIERIEKDHKSSIDQMFFVLLQWRKKLHSSFSDLEEALRRCNIDIHVLCEVCKTNVFETDVKKNLPSDILDKVLSDQELDEIAGYIGREYLQLCLQLGHTVSHIERVMDENKYNFLEGIRVLLRDWRKSGHLKPTVKMLGCAWLQCGMDFNVFYNLFVKQEKDLWQLPFIF